MGGVVFPSIFLKSSVQLLSHVQLFASPWTVAHQASPSITNSWSLLKFMSFESVMPSNHLLFCRPLLFLPSIFPSLRVFSNESVLHIRWPKYWHFSFTMSLLCQWNVLGKNTGVGCHFLLQGIFPTQGSNLKLLYWRAHLP